MKKQPRIFSSQMIPLLFSVCMFAFVLFEIAYYSSRTYVPNANLVSGGLNYLSASDIYSPKYAEDFFQAKKDERRAQLLKDAEYKNLVDSIKNDKVNIWSYFSDYVMLGDSRALDYCHYNFLSYSRVLAANGNTLENIDGHLRTIKSMHPSYIYICYGLNDILNKPNATGEDYADTMIEKIELIRQQAPKARIVVSSILWCTDEVVSKRKAFKKITPYNKACKEICKSHNIPYADNDDLCRKYIDTLWEPDGIHPSHSFYKYWAQNLIIASLQFDYEFADK